AILLETNGVLWIGTVHDQTSGAGVTRYEPGAPKSRQLTYFTKTNGLIGGATFCFNRDGDGTPWAGPSPRLFRWDGVQFQSYFEGPAIRSLYRDPTGVMWGSGPSGLFRWEGNAATVFRKTDGLAGSEVRIIHSDPISGMWVGTSSGISRLDERSILTYTTADG